MSRGAVSRILGAVLLGLTTLAYAQPAGGVVFGRVPGITGTVAATARCIQGARIALNKPEG